MLDGKAEETLEVPPLPPKKKEELQRNASRASLKTLQRQVGTKATKAEVQEAALEELERRSKDPNVKEKSQKKAADILAAHRVKEVKEHLHNHPDNVKERLNKKLAADPVLSDPNLFESNGSDTPKSKKTTSAVTSSGVTTADEKLAMQAEYTENAFKNADNVLGKDAVGWIPKSENFNVVDGKVVGVKNPKTGEWKGADPTQNKDLDKLDSLIESNDRIARKNYADFKNWPQLEELARTRGLTVKEGASKDQIIDQLVEYDRQNPTKGTPASPVEQSSPLDVSELTEDQRTSKVAEVFGTPQLAKQGPNAVTSIGADGADVTPAAQKLAEREGLDLTETVGTGKNGKLTIADVRALKKAVADKTGNDSIIKGLELNDELGARIVKLSKITDSNKRGRAVRSEVIAGMVAEGHQMTANPFNASELIFRDKAALEIDVDSNGNLWLKSVRSLKKGGSIPAIRNLVKHAKKNNITITGYAKPFDTHIASLSRKRLVKFYEKLGATVTNNWRVTWNPEAKKTNELTIKVKHTPVVGKPLHKGKGYTPLGYKRKAQKKVPKGAEVGKKFYKEGEEMDNPTYPVTIGSQNFEITSTQGYSDGTLWHTRPWSKRPKEETRYMYEELPTDGTYAFTKNDLIEMLVDQVNEEDTRSLMGGPNNELGARRKVRQDFKTKAEYVTYEKIQKQTGVRSLYEKEVRRNAYRVDSAKSGQSFHDGISKTYRDHPVGKAVEVKDLDFYKDKKNGIFMSEDGLAGAAVTDYADLVSVFKHPTSKAKPREILAEATQYTKSLDAYDVGGFLPNLYSEYGFTPVARVKFNKEFAPEGWPFELLGEPDIVLMVKDPDQSFAPIKMEQKGFNKVRNLVPYMDGEVAWDYAGEIAQQAQAEELGARKKDGTRGTLGTVRDGEILYTKSGNLHQMGHKNSQGHPWRYNETTQTVYWWDGKPTEIDKDTVEILLDKKGHEVSKNVTIEDGSKYLKHWEEAHGMGDGGQQFDFSVFKGGFSNTGMNEYGARASMKGLKLSGKTVGGRVRKGGRSYTEVDITKEAVGHSWLMPDGKTAIDIGMDFHVNVLRSLAQNQPNHPFIKEMVEGLKANRAKGAISAIIAEESYTDTLNRLNYEDAQNMGMFRVRVEKDGFGEVLYIEGKGPANKTAKDAAWHMGFLPNRTVMYENADNPSAGPEILYDPPAGGYGVEDSDMSQGTTKLADDLDKARYWEQGARKKMNWMSRTDPSNDASRIGTSYTGEGTSPQQNIGKTVVARETFVKHMKQMNSPHLPANIREETDPDAKYEKLVTFFKENLLALHDKFPKAIRNRATHWYDGANELAKRAAQVAGVSIEQAAGVIAAMSPQKDWFQNVAQGEQFLQMWGTERDTKITEEYGRATVERIVKATVVSDSRKKKKKPDETPRQKVLRTNYNRRIKEELMRDRRVIMDKILDGGKTINQLDGYDRYWAMRIVLETKFGKNYQALSPEGQAIGLQMNDDGKTPSQNGWGGRDQLDKAISIIEDGSIENISNNMGEAHKVRNFYNNIIAPNSPSGDATIDTHAVAAAHLLPFSGKSKEVKQNFGNPAATGKGVSGTYYIYLDAYQQAAKERNIMPRQMQSITWEAIRMVYPKGEKNPNLVGVKQKTWQNEKSEANSRTELTSGEIGEPIWARTERSGELGARHTVVRENVRAQANLRGSVRSRNRQAPTAPLNGIEIDPRTDPTGFNHRLFGAELGARRGYTPTTQAIAANTKVVASAGQQVFLNQSLSMVDRLKAVAEVVGDPIRVKLQDKMLPVRRLIDAMEDVRGGTFDDDLQTYVKHENYHGTTGAELTNWAEAHERPIAQAVVDNSVDVEVLDDLMHLRHAQERNTVNREQSKEVTITYRGKNGQLKKRVETSYGAENRAKQFAQGFKVRWDSSSNGGTVKNNVKEFKNQKQAEAFARNKIAKGLPNVRLTKGRLTGYTISAKSGVEAGSGYSDEAAHHALALNDGAIHRMYANGLLTEAQRDRIIRMIKTVKANPNGLKAYEAVTDKVDALNKLSLERQYKSGLIGKSDYDRISKAYKHYVPLRGWDEVSAYYEASSMPSPQTTYGSLQYKTTLSSLFTQTVLPISQGMNTAKHRLKSSAGLSEDTTVANHLAYSFAMARQGIVESQKNEVMRSFFDMVATAHKDPALQGITKSQFSYTKGVMITTVDKKGKPRKQLDPRWKDDPNIIGMKINGVTVAMRLAPDRLDGTSSVARALKNLGAEKTGVLVRTVKLVTRTMAALRTTLSPAFTPVNFVRDWGMGLYSIQGIQSDFQHAIDRGEMTEDQVERIRKRAMANLMNPNTLRKAFQGAVNQTTGGRGMRATQAIEGAVGKQLPISSEVQKWSDIFQDFSDNGGRINFFGHKSPQETARDFGNIVADFDPDNPQKMKRFLKGSYEFMDTVSGAVENLVRVTTYQALLDEGVSKQKAANVALNLTTNFTRKGEWTAALNGMYLFFNAGVQGSYKVLSTAYKSKRATKFLAGAVLLGFMNSLFNRLLAPDDEELGTNAWDRVSPYSKTHNLHFFGFLPEQGHFKMPSPYGINVFTSAGTLIENMMFGNMKTGDAAMTWASTALESFSPIGGSSMASALTPTALQPITDLALNEDYKGAPVYKEDHFNKETPDSALHWSNTSETSKWLASGLNSITGGDKQRGGGIDVSPDTLDYMANYVFGGLGGFLGRSADFVNKSVSGKAETPNINDVPIVRRFVGGETTYYDTERFYRLVNHISVSKKRVEAYRNKPAEFSSVQQYEAPRMALNSLYSKNPKGGGLSVQKQLAAIRKHIKAFEDNSNMDGNQRRDAIDKLKRRRKVVMGRFMKRAEQLGVDDF